jgi:uroporphyrinogen-III synthase
LSDINIAITKEEIEDDDIPQQIIYGFKEKLNIITLPTIVTVPIHSIDITNSIKKIENGFYNYYIFLSAHSVDIFFKSIKNEKNANNILKEILKINKKNDTFIAIGPKTKKALGKNNLKSNIVTSTKTTTNNNTVGNKIEFSLDSIMEFLDNIDKSNGKDKIKILMPRSSESQKSNNFIKKIYKNLVLEQVFFYETIEFNKIEESSEWNKFKSLTYQKELKYLIFTSPSTVRAFFKIMVNNIYQEKQLLLTAIKNEQELVNLLGIKLIISLGPKTSEELKKRNILYLESDEHTVKGALKYLLKTMK